MFDLFFVDQIIYLVQFKWHFFAPPEQKWRKLFALRGANIIWNDFESHPVDDFQTDLNHICSTWSKYFDPRGVGLQLEKSAGDLLHQSPLYS